MLSAVWELLRYVIGLAVLVPFLVLTQTEPMFEGFGIEVAVLAGLSLLPAVVRMIRAGRNLAELLSA